jgi:hypothetical protein
VGFRRGRRHPDEVRAGDALDFWRVFEAKPQEEETLLMQTAFFAPKGLSGFLYWYLLYPLHGLIFSGLIRNLARRAEAYHGVDAI